MGFYQIPSARGFPDFKKIVPAVISFVQFQGRIIMREAEMKLKGYTPTDSGFMRQMAKTWGFRVYGAGGWRFWLGWRKTDFYGRRAFYPPFVETGTGVFGPKHRSIRPVKAKRLAWKTPGGRWVSSVSVKGQVGQHMLNRTVKEMIPRIASMMWEAFRFGFARSFK